MVDNELTLLKFGYDLNQAKTTQKICCVCDYCNEQFFRTKKHLLQGRSKINKDCCNKCVPLKIKDVNILIYGVDSPIKNKTIKNKIKQTNLERYGVENPSQNENVKNKLKQTNLERYGSECSLNNKDVQDKIKQTNLERYGVEHPIQNDDIKNKLKQTNLERYGVEHPIQNEDIKNKIKQTNLERYGSECSLNNKDVQDKIKQTNLERYGVEHHFENRDIQIQCMEKRIEKYGSLHTQYGKTENEIKNWLNSLGFSFKSNNSVLKGREIDFYNEQLKLGIEYCGLYWHTEDSLQPRDKKYHYSKYLMCKVNGIRLITIFEDEWLYRNSQCKSYLQSVLGIFDKRIYARNCNIDQISIKSFDLFCDENHIQGKSRLTIVSYGLFDGNCLVGVIGLGSHHRKNNGILVLNRMCFKQGVQIIGGASKLFSKCQDWCKCNNFNEIISWSDNRWSDGKIYKILEFNNSQNLMPDYSYVNLKQNERKRLSKQSCKKRNIKCPLEFTEKQWMNNLGYSRIWDCGKIRWEFKIK